MEIELRRLRSNHLYTEGVLIINEQRAIPCTVEHTFTMLPTGKYKVKLTRDETAHRRIIGILPSPAYFDSGHSYLSAKAFGNVILGESLIPGSVKNSREHYDRLMDRIEKCEQRKESISLIITDEHCEESKVSRVWLK